jgi:predicted GTPase
MPKSNYRLELANNAHNAILKFMSGKISKNELSTVISHLDEASMLFPSINGQTHLMDILHLTFKISHHSHQEKCIYMMNVLLGHAEKLGGNVAASLLTQADKDDCTPTYYVFLNGNTDVRNNYKVYIQELIKRKKISADIYHQLLLKSNKNGFTILHHLLQNEDFEKVIDFFGQLFYALDKQAMSHDLYV